MDETTIQIPGVITADLGDGAKLVQGPKGDDGASAYEQALAGGYNGTEEEFEQSLATIDTKAAAAATAATTAEAAKDAAEAAQEAAEAAQTAATQSATNARNSAGGAQQSAEDAGTARDAAESAAGDAEGSAVAAADSATAAATSATNAANSATTATDKAGDAADSADAASGSATAAAGSASTASSAATTAVAARDAIVNMELDVTTLAPDADATASGSFADGKYILSLGIPQGQKGDTGNQGIQGVTGVGISKVEQTGGNHAAGTMDTYTIYFTDGTTTTFQIYNGANGEGSGDFMANGTVAMTGNLNAGGNRVINLATPEADTDATPRSYVDSAAGERIPNTQKGAAGGVATLDSSGKVPAAQLPSMDYIPTSQKGAASGVAELDSTGRVPSSQLPSYVDDVIETYIVGSTAFASDWLSTTNGGAALTPESGKIYIVLSGGSYQNREFRWSGTQYAEISPSIALGETSSTAYRGDRGKAAYDHSQLTSGNPHGTTAADVGAVPTGRTVNGKALSANIELNAGDVGARPASWTPTADDVGAVPTARKINNKQLNADITLTASDVNAASKASYVSATLTTSGWSSNAQTLTVSGVLADATKQLIVPCPQNETALTAWTEAGVKAVSQAANSLTFKCDSTPSANIPLYIAIIPIGS